MATPKRRKPSKPSPEYPLFAHGSGQWAKKIKGRLRYFGAWGDPEQALENYKAFVTGHPRASKLAVGDPESELSVDAMVQLFLADRDEASQRGEISRQTFEDYKPVGKTLIEYFGDHTHVDKLRPHHFAGLKTLLSKRVPPHRSGRKPKGQKSKARTKPGKDLGRVTLKTLESRIGRARAFFNWAAKNALIDSPLPKLWGTQFAKPGRELLVKQRNAKPPKMLDPDEIHRLLALASPAFKAMLLLGINGGVGNTDVARITPQHLDLDGGWLNLPRQKTGELRRIPLWPETIEAIHAAIVDRREPLRPEDAELLFVTKYRGSWSGRGDREQQSPISQEFARLRRLAGIPAGGKTYYSMRHTFATVAASGKDIDAVTYLMGHRGQSTRERHYMQARPDDDRLRDCVEVVRAWLFASK